MRGVSFEVKRGEVFCLLGPNGAGKTTTVEILEGYRVRSGGEVSVLGFDPARGEREMRERVGIVLQQCGVQSDLSVAELLEMYGSYHLHPRPIDEVLELVELGAKRDERAGELSGGQRRRLDLALALVGDPELIFLDEPTTGFDPAARHAAWSTIRSLCELGKTVFLTTHFMDEAQHLADRVAIMRDGEIIALGSPDELGGRDARPAEIRFALPAGVGLDQLPLMPYERCTLDGGRALIVTARAGRGAAAAHRLGDRPRAPLARLSVSQPTLEDIYLELTGVAAETARSWRRRSHEHPDDSRLELDAAPRSRPRRPADPLRAALLLAQPRPRRVHVRVPADVPGDLRLARHGGHISSLGGIPYDDFLVPGILAYGVITTTFTNLSITTAILRDAGRAQADAGHAAAALGLHRGADRLDARWSRRRSRSSRSCRGSCSGASTCASARCRARSSRCCSARRRSPRSGSGWHSSSPRPRPAR